MLELEAFIFSFVVVASFPHYVLKSSLFKENFMLFREDHSWERPETIAFV